MYNPSYFLGALGSGGLSVTFFLLLMFWYPHTGHPIPTYEDWRLAFDNGTGLDKVIISAALMGIASLSILHFKLLFKNLKQWFSFKKTEEFGQFKSGAGGITQMAIYLTLAMSINASFILGAVFVPSLWTVVEYLFPGAVIAFFLVGIFAIKNYLEILVIQNRGEGVKGSLVTLLPAFAFAMIAVGFAAPAAMSHVHETQVLAILLSAFFGALSFWVIIQNIGSSFASIHNDGIQPLAMPTLWILVPILTILMIMGIRLDHGLHMMSSHGGKGGTSLGAIWLGLVFFVQTAVLVTGYVTMKGVRFFERLREGEFNSPAAYALVCPGVAYAVSLHFFVNKGLVASHFIEKFGVTYWSLSAVAVAIAIFTLKGYLSLLKNIEK